MLKVVCIPAFNEERTITNVIERATNFVDKVIVCNDGSNDKTSKMAREAGAIVIEHKKNLGKGAALKSLFKYIKKLDFDVMVTLDGDGQFIPDEIDKLMKPILDDGIDIVIGNRYDKGGEMASYRKAGNKILDKITNMASDLSFQDTQSGFRAYSKKAINSISFSNDGFGADSEILVDASKKDLKISEVKVSVLYNTGGKTSTKNPVSHSAGVLTTLLELIALRHPLRYLGIPGMILMIIGIVTSVNVLTTFNEIRYFSIPFTLLSLGTLVIGVMLLLMSVVLFSIGKNSQRRD